MSLHADPAEGVEDRLHFALVTNLTWRAKSRNVNDSTAGSR